MKSLLVFVFSIVCCFLLFNCQQDEGLLLDSWKHTVTDEETVYDGDTGYYTTIYDSRFKRGGFYDIWIDYGTGTYKITFADINIYDGKMIMWTFWDLARETLIIFYST